MVRKGWNVIFRYIFHNNMDMWLGIEVFCLFWSKGKRVLFFLMLVISMSKFLSIVGF